MRLTSGHKGAIFDKNIKKTGNPRYLGTKQENNLLSKLIKCGRWKLHSSETEIDAQACNALQCVVWIKRDLKKYILRNSFFFLLNYPLIWIGLKFNGNIFVRK